MANISDIIEEFILRQLQDDETINLSRRELADFFNCAPSQINYVLNTRFTVNRGFLVESQRGGGGYIKLMRVQDNNSNFLNNALQICNQPINVIQANQLLSNLQERDLISSREAEIIKASISAKALNNPLNIDNIIRANVLKQVILELMKYKGKEEE